LDETAREVEEQQKQSDVGGEQLHAVARAEEGRKAKHPQRAEDRAADGADAADDRDRYETQ